MMMITCSGGEAPDLAHVQSTVSMTTIVAVAIAMLVALLIAIDVSCYFINACGLTMCISVHVCGRHSAGASTKPASDKDADDPERYAYLYAHLHRCIHSPATPLNVQIKTPQFINLHERFCGLAFLHFV